MTAQALSKIFEWFTAVELIVARIVMFALFVLGLWTVFKWAASYLSQQL